MAYILVVDDDQDVLGTLERTLRREGHEVETARSAAEAQEKLAKRQPDLLILDILMPGKDGLTLCKELRSDPAFNSMPILFLTAKTGTEDVVAGLDAGGDDYVKKPFVPAELNARVRALLRRGLMANDGRDVLVVGGLRLDSGSYQVEVEGRPVQLTRTEHRLLRYMMERPNRPLSPRHLLEHVWDYPRDAGDPDLVRAHIRNLRAKIERDSSSPKYIRTVHGIGYMISKGDDRR